MAIKMYTGQPPSHNIRAAYLHGPGVSLGVQHLHSTVRTQQIPVVILSIFISAHGMYSNEKAEVISCCISSNNVSKSEMYT